MLFEYLVVASDFFRLVAGYRREYLPDLGVLFMVSMLLLFFFLLYSSFVSHSSLSGLLILALLLKFVASFTAPTASRSDTSEAPTASFYGTFTAATTSFSSSFKMVQTLWSALVVAIVDCSRSALARIGLFHASLTLLIEAYASPID